MSSRGDCNKPVEGSQLHCANHGCPTSGCSNPKSSKDGTCLTCSAQQQHTKNQRQQELQDEQFDGFGLSANVDLTSNMYEAGGADSSLGGYQVVAPTTTTTTTTSPAADVDAVPHLPMKQAQHAVYV